MTRCVWVYQAFVQDQSFRDDLYITRRYHEYPVLRVFPLGADRRRQDLNHAGYYREEHMKGKLTPPQGRCVEMRHPCRLLQHKPVTPHPDVYHPFHSIRP